MLDLVLSLARLIRGNWRKDRHGDPLVEAEPTRKRMLPDAVRAAQHHWQHGETELACEVERTRLERKLDAKD